MHAMAFLVKWTFNAANRVEDVWWKEMVIGAQLLCEHYLQASHHGDSKIYFNHERTLYVIDLVKMTQQNLSTGRLRHIRRVEEPFVPPSQSLPFLRSLPEACHTADNSFRERDPFRDRLEDDKRKRSITEPSQKHRKHRR
jgi:hypothetical protein